MTGDGRIRVPVTERPEPGASEAEMRRPPALAPDEAPVRVRHAGICGAGPPVVGWNAQARGDAPPRRRCG